MKSRSPAAWLLALCTGFLAGAAGTDAGTPPSAAVPLRGPGLGNLAYTETELFQPISLIRNESAPGAGDGDMPFRHPGRKEYGSNVGLMVNGYFVLMFAPDSGQSTGGFLVYDVSNPRQPRLVRKIHEPTGRTAEFREPHAIGQATIAGRQYLVVPSTRGIEFWDFTDVNDIRQVKKLELPSVHGGDYSRVTWQLWWQAPYVYVASADDGMYIVDARDPANAALARRGEGRPNPVPTGELGGFRVGPIFTMGNHLVLSSMEASSGLASLDLSDPLNPRLLDRVGELPFYYATCFDGRHLHGSVRGRGARMFSYDLADPARFVAQDNRLAMDDQLYCATQDRFVFQGAQEMVHKVDVSDPLNHRHVGRGGLFPEGSEAAHHSDHGQVTPMGNLLFVGNDHGTASGFIVHDRQPDRTPPEVRQVSPRPGAVRQATTSRIGIALSDNILPESVHAGSFIVRPRGGQPLAGLYSVQQGIVNFAPAEGLAPHTRYEVLVPAGGLRDYAGNPVANAFKAEFTTGAASPPMRDDEDELEAQRRAAVRIATPAAEQTLLVGTRAEFHPRALALDGARYSWSFGDRTPRTPFSRTLRATHTFKAPGHYTVLLNVRGADGHESTYAFHRSVIHPRTATSPTHSSNIVGNATHVFSLNPDSGTVTAIDADTLAKAWETRVGQEPRTLAIGPDGRVWVTVQGDDELVALNAKDGSVSARVRLPYGSAPHGVVFTPDQQAGLLTLEGRSTLLSFDPATGASRASLALPGDVRGIAVTSDSKQALVTRFRSRMDRGEVHRVSIGESLSLLQTVALRVDTTTVDAENRARGVPNYLHQVVISPDGRRATLPSKKDNIVGGLFRDGRPLEHDTTVRSIVSQIDLRAGGAELFAEQIDFNDRAPARAAAYSPNGDYLFVAQMEGNRVAIVDAYNGSVRGEIETGRAPHGLHVDERRQRLYVNHFLDRSVGVHDIAPVLSAASFAARPLAAVATVAVEPLPDAVLRGKRVFYNAADPRMSRNNYMSCAACHADGGDDGMVWDFTQRGEGLRRTISLQGRQGLGHGRVHWSANFDELQDFENDIRGALGGTGFLSDADFEATSDPLGRAKAGRSTELDDLAAYLASLSRRGRSPAREADGSLGPQALRGQHVFHAMRCASCHAGPELRDGRRHDVGTIQASSGKGLHRPLGGVGFSTPPLYGLWAAPSYFHNGQAATLHDVLAAGHGGTRGLPAADRDALVEYLRSLDASSAPLDIASRP